MGQFAEAECRRRGQPQSATAVQPGAPATQPCSAGMSQYTWAPAACIQSALPCRRRKRGTCRSVIAAAQPSCKLRCRLGMQSAVQHGRPASQHRHPSLAASHAPAAATVAPAATAAAVPATTAVTADRGGEASCGVRHAARSPGCRPALLPVAAGPAAVQLLPVTDSRQPAEPIAHPPSP